VESLFFVDEDDQWEDEEEDWGDDEWEDDD
jgi:hypothetical protein